MIDVKPPQPKKGVLILALGSTTYVKYALNLAVSIRKTSPNIPVCLVHNGNIHILEPSQKFFFNRLIECPSEYYTTDGKISYIKAKLYLDKLTPYDKTLFLDADTLVSPYKSVISLFEKCEGNDFVMVCRGENKDSSEWVNKDEVMKAFELEKWYDCSSEVMYFEKTNVFDDARNINKAFEQGSFYYRQFAGGVPDEASLVTAMLVNHGTPKFVPFKPTFWEAAEKSFVKSEEIFTTFELLSVGGNRVSKHIENIYNLLIKWYKSNTGCNTFTYESKMRLQERRTV